MRLSSLAKEKFDHEEAIEVLLLLGERHAPPRRRQCLYIFEPVVPVEADWVPTNPVQFWHSAGVAMFLDLP